MLKTQDPAYSSPAVPPLQWNRARTGPLVRPEISLDPLAAVVLALVLAMLFLYLGISVSVAVPLSVLMGLASYRFIQLALHPQTSDVFHPTTLVATYFALYFGLRTFFLTTVPFFGRVGRNPYDDFIPAALWCASVAYVSFLWGMKSPMAARWVRRAPSLTPQLARTVPAWQLLCMMAMGFACLVYLVKIGMVVGNYTDRAFQRDPPPGLVILFENLVDFSWVAVCVYLVTSTEKSRRGLVWILAGISLMVLAVKLAISGGKIGLIQPLMEAAIVVHYGKRRLRIWEMVMIGVPAVILAFGVVNFYRFVVVGQHGSPKSLADVASRISSAADLMAKQRSAGNGQSALDQMVDRDAGTDAVALIIKYTPRPFGYVLGRHWIEIPLTFIPRQIWKNKPVNMPSAEFESSYMGLSSRYNGFSSMHLIGDLYRNFSWLGVLGGMFLLGAALRFFYLFCSPRRCNPTGLFLYAALFPEIIHSLESDAGYTFINLSRAAILAVGVALVLGARFHRARRPAKSTRIPVVARSPRYDGNLRCESGFHRPEPGPGFSLP